MLPDTDPLRQIALEQGVFLRSEALAFGHDDNSLRRSLRAGVLTRVRHGSYTFSDLWHDLSSEQRHLVRSRAAMRRLDGVALSHVSAAIAHGLDLWRMDLERVHVTRIDGGAGGVHGDVVHHEGFASQDDVGLVGDVRVVVPVRAALETTLLGGTERGLVTLSSGLRRGCFSTDALLQQYSVMSQWPGARNLHIAVRLADGAHESVGEVRASYLFWSQGLPRPVAQLEVRDPSGQLIGRVDFAWPRFRLVVEFDGAVKYERHARPGETPGDVVFREKRREDALRAAGWTVVRITWSDLSHPRETAYRIRAAMRQAA